MKLSNLDISKILYEIAAYLEMDNVQFKPRAYEKAADVIEALEEDIHDIYKKGGLKALEEIPGIGLSIAGKIEELIKKGRLQYYEDLKRKVPVDLENLLRVEGLGVKSIKKLYQELKIKNLNDLEKSAKAGKIRNLEGFGEKSEENILKSIEFLKKSKGRFLLGEILPKVKEIYEALKNLKEVEKVDACGSVRRMKETIGDVDFLVISNKPGKIMDFFVSLPGVIKIWGKGATKSSIRIKEGFDIDIRVVPKKSYGAALQYFTGSKEHNIALREIAIKKGYKLNEYGLFQYPGSRISQKNLRRSDFQKLKQIAGENEKEIYEKLGMDWIPPEMRENQGEIGAALKNKLPEIINLKDIKGDLHCHSDWNGGVNSIEELAEAARKIGYQYIGIADHTKFLRIEHGLDEKKLEQRNKAIDKLNLKFKIKNLKFRALKGCEANIMADGSIDIKDEALKKLDFVIAGVHSQFKMTKEKMTERIITAMKNPHVDIISHPTGRILKRRDEYQIDFTEILKAAKETKTVLEINAFPDRLDLNDINIRRAKEMGVKMVINTDAHHVDHMRLMEYGISQARRGWATKNDIINAWPLEKMLRMLKK